MTSPEKTDQIWEKAREFTLNWIERRQGSALEYVWEVQEQVGWPVRFCLLELLRDLRDSRELADPQRKYLFYTLCDDAVSAALADGAKPGSEHQSALDELFTRSRRFRTTAEFAEAVDFVSKFRDYSPYNNMLVYLQNPLATYFATASHWRKTFGRTIKENGRGMIILAPRTPVLLVYDIADTEGPRLPAKLELFTKTSGRFDPKTLDHTLKNCGRDRILVERKSMGPLRGGFASVRERGRDHFVKITIREELDDSSAYAVLCHELAHVYLGHLGAVQQGWWPYRLAISDAIAEIEAEAVSYTVCRRAGVVTHSAEYLSTYIKDDCDLSGISLDLVSRVAARIEEMGRKLLPARHSKEVEPF